MWIDSIEYYANKCLTLVKQTVQKGTNSSQKNITTTKDYVRSFYPTR